MENQNNLVLNDQAVAALRESAKWCMFLSILGFIGIAFMIIAGLFMSVAMSAMPDNPELGSAMGPLGAIKAYFGIMYIVIAAFYFLPSICTSHFVLRTFYFTFCLK